MLEDLACNEKAPDGTHPFPIFGYRSTEVNHNGRTPCEMCIIRLKTESSFHLPRNADCRKAIGGCDKVILANTGTETGRGSLSGTGRGTRAARGRPRRWLVAAPLRRRAARARTRK